jgi:hypothetical protein
MNPYLITRGAADFNKQVDIKTFKKHNNKLLGWAYYAPRFVLEFLEPMMEEWFNNYIKDNFTEDQRAKYASIWYSDGSAVTSDEEHRELIAKQAIFMYEYYQWCKATIAREFPQVYNAMYYRWRRIDNQTKQEYMHWPSYDTWKDRKIVINTSRREHQSLDKFIPRRLLFEGQIQGPNTWRHLKKYYEQDYKNMFLWRYLWKPEAFAQNQLMKISAKARKAWSPEFYENKEIFGKILEKEITRDQPVWQHAKDMRGY